MTTVICHDIYNNQHPTPTASLQWRPAAYVVLIKDDSVCLLKTLNGTYDLPGGAIELGEDPKSAAIREVKEETGLDATEPTLLGVESSLFRAVHSDDRCYHSLLMYYHCDECSGEFSNEGFDEVERRLVEGAEWVPLESLDGIKVGSTVDFRPYVRQAYEARCVADSVIT
jgi:8-oxo-dGTP diphosphatase